MALDYFYDGQIRAYLVQVIRAFSGFQYSMGKNADGSEKLRTIPATAASRDSQVASIINNNSENTILSTPQITIDIVNIEIDNLRRQNTNHVDTVQVHEREIDKISNKYTSERGKSYTVERFMPVPYTLTFQVDIWTSNTLQKHQIMEQILVLFNPAIDIQTSTNPIDWSALTHLEMTNIQWTSRSIPIGTNTGAIEIATISLKAPVWINPPAKVKKHRLIEQVVTHISALDSTEVEKNKDFDLSAVDWARGDIFKREITTPGNHSILIEGNKIKLLGEDTNPTNALGEPWNWRNLFELYGKYRPGESLIELLLTDDLDNHEDVILCNVTINEDDSSILDCSFDISTLPMNNLPNINAIIDPHRTWPTPANAIAAPNPLPTPKVGDRYMILNEIAPQTMWRTLLAHKYDIIEYGEDGFWFVAFNASSAVGTYTTTNLMTGQQITWNGSPSNGSEPGWNMTVGGVYTPGFWRIHL